ncbi:MAG TPA: threonine--tRNA ligase [Kiritimatiellia bacterium]|nr:threonine--tRNA ligase [Kiritimatiellia bacterium]HPA77328.1 threonine--tRNA ligase [Kiritimatiellia bacterium]HQQ04363.1 threonine--tRNA ligase [Kiritimatiellia bacterium]
MKPEKDLELHRMRHSAAHVMAAAVCRLYEDVQLDIGPDTDEGFYYDFDLEHRLTPEDFPQIEAEMQKIVKEDIPFERIEVPREEALKILQDRKQRYKVERLADIPEGDTISFYKCGDFMDLCRGPHVESTGKIKAFKLLSVAGSYYRGRETNPMLQRLYATAFLSEKEVRNYLRQLEEAAKRDHRKLGRELDLFSFQEKVGPGLVHWHPKGARIRVAIEDYWRKKHLSSGYELIFTPHIGQAQLWETSGHLGFYRESMYAPMDVDGKEYFVKPMNCPFHIQIFNSRKRSYRELPLRWAELGTVYRYEKAGVLHGLFRVRGFTQDDAHIYCTPDQMESEIRNAVRFAGQMWRDFGFTEISAFVSTRPDKAVGDPARWDDATRALEAALKEEKIAYEVDQGGGAFYGPKIDMKVRDAIGREWQVSTIQFDFNEPERFDMSFIGEDGREHRPYMIHRALLGSIERFFGILVEHYAGAFPLWLAPEQVRVLPLTDKQMPYAEKVAEQLAAADFRATVDHRQEKIGAKIRAAQMEKIPYMLVVGPQEEEKGVVALRSRLGGDQGAVRMEDLMARLDAEIASKGLNSTEE